MVLVGLGIVFRFRCRFVEGVVGSFGFGVGSSSFFRIADVVG